MFVAKAAGTGWFEHRIGIKEDYTLERSTDMEIMKVMEILDQSAVGWCLNISLNIDFKYRFWSSLLQFLDSKYFAR